MPIAQHIYPLKGKVQHYTWGGYDYIPELLSIANEEKRPHAEYWLGAHPNYSSTINKNGEAVLLDKFISDHKEVLGVATKQFDTSPFLLKILDVRQMLSIQVHPNKTSAEIGFHKENELGIPLTASYRNYKDANHKPEMMVALSDFWLLHGFKPADKLIETLSAIPDFNFLVKEFKIKGYKALYEKVMLMDQGEVNKILKPVIDKILPLYKNGELLKSQESFWAARAAESFCTDGNYDRGIFSIYFFNLVHLKKGEGIYQGAQLPHAYMEGQNVELMSNSDNVLRAGLTDKHIDIDELLKHVSFVETVPDILGSYAEVKEEIRFTTPAKEFQLYQYHLHETTVDISADSAEIILLLSGNASIKCGDEILQLKKGDSAFIVGGSHYSISASSVEIFRATTPAFPD
jgi:mannose-6-phosphate isomerase